MIHVNINDISLCEKKSLDEISFFKWILLHLKVTHRFSMQFILILKDIYFA